jgi:hypothetical protein
VTRYRFHWRDGSTSEGEGRSVADALAALNLGEYALIQLKQFVTVDQERDEA